MIARMLNPSSQSIMARTYRRAQFIAIVMSVLLHTLMTVDALVASHGALLYVIEAAISFVFAFDYGCRWLTCPERRRYAGMGAFAARLRWALSFEALIDVTSFGPFFVDAYLITPGARSLPSFGWVRIFRVFLLFRTARWAGAVRTVSRVLFVNREILTTSLALVSLTILLTSTLLHAACADDAECGKAHGTADLPSAMYVATMMLTGQASPEGELPPAMRLVCILTAFLSVPFFAVPAAMLTWGFEGEAQRLATRERRRVNRRALYAHESAAAAAAPAGAPSSSNAAARSSSSSSSDEEYEEYIDGLGGGDSGEDERKGAAERALDFFVDAGSRGRTPRQGEQETGSMLFGACALASTLQRGAQTSARRRQRQRDALELLEKLQHDFDEGLSGEQATRLEARLAAFARAAAADDDASDVKAGEEAAGGSDGAEASIASLQREVASLRETTAKELSELKESVEQIARLLTPS